MFVGAVSFRWTATRCRYSRPRLLTLAGLTSLLLIASFYNAGATRFHAMLEAGLLELPAYTAQHPLAARRLPRLLPTDAENARARRHMLPAHYRFNLPPLTATLRAVLFTFPEFAYHQPL
jgi:hypothetical protein